jgi:thymidylate kinase
MLIIEGADLTGKTTLAHNLLKHRPLNDRGYVYKHFTRLPGGFHRYWGYVDNATQRSVQDRFHMSEVMYAEARGDKDKYLTPEMYRLVEAHLALLGSYTVLITADEQLIRERWREGEMYDIELVRRVNELYLHTQLPFDYHFHANAHRPFMDDVEQRRVLDKYFERQATLERMLIDAPPGKARGLHLVG